jgi:uncharacterized protein (DUF58 family)
LERWIDARHPDGLATTLEHRNVYILPTRAGLGYGALLLVLLVASINYQLNLGYLLTFILTGVGAMSMHLTHNNLRGLTLALQPPEPAHAGGAARVRLVVTGRKSHRYGIALWFERPETAAHIDVEPGAPSICDLSVPVARRGLHPLPRLSLESRFPLGLWRAWSYWRPSAAHGAQLLVYPKPEQPLRPLPTAIAVPAGGDALAHRQASAGEFDGVRPYRSGDQLKRIVWKKLARADELVSRDDMSTVKTMLVLDMAALGSLDDEARLSRLTSWVLQCERQDLPFELRLQGGYTLPCDHGHGHTLAALRALALWNLPGNAPESMADGAAGGASAGADGG